MTLISDKYLAQLRKSDEQAPLLSGVVFNEMLNKAMNHAKRRGQMLALLLMDLDMFKLVVSHLDTANSAEDGQLILTEMGKRLTHSLRQEDVVAKLGDDEFAVLLMDIGKAKFSGLVAKKILHACSQLLKIRSQAFNITASIGISIYPHDGRSLEELFKNADRALLKAKQAGGNQYQFHVEKISEEAHEYLKLASAFKKAIHNNELALYFQPRFHIKTGKVNSVEGLMRWEHPSLGVVDPRVFIQLAEESGLMMQVGEWALREACQRIRYWQNDRYEHISIALKLSPKQFHHPDIASLIAKVISSEKIDPQYIEFEITERTTMEDAEAACAILEKIKATGVRLSIDHFGTGYTSIKYLKQFPISAIKIDKSFIKGIPNNPNDCTIVSAVIALTKKLGLSVIAEGVETAEQVQFLSEHHCDVMQGYFLCHPISPQKITSQFRKLQDEVLV